MKYYLLKYIGDNSVEVASAVMPKQELDMWLEGQPDLPQCDNYHNGKLGQELVDDGIVELFEVTKSVHDMYDKYDIQSLSNCNIFTEYISKADLLSYASTSDTYNEDDYYDKCSN